MTGAAGTQLQVDNIYFTSGVNTTFAWLGGFFAGSNKSPLAVLTSVRMR
jgi:hypothetical protein